MADITIELVPSSPPLPSDDDPAKEYGEFNYIFYPGISECKLVRLTNTTADPITPHIYFDRDESDEIWWKTLRIFPTCSGVLPSGVIDTYWEGIIAGSGTQDLYIRSICTKEGFSWKYEPSYWTNNGFVVLSDINDNEEYAAAVDCDAAAVGATLTLDTLTTIPAGTRVSEEFSRIKFSFDGTVNATFDIQYSDDNITYTTVYEDADLSTRGVRAQKTFWWDRAGSHRYWRISKTNDAAAGANITEIQWLLFEAHEDAYDFGVYGDHKATVRDYTDHMDDYQLRTNVQVNVDVFSRQNYQKPIGRVGKRTKISARNFAKNGQTVQVYYIPAVTFSANLNTKVDYQLEKRVWDMKVFIAPQKRSLTYTAATSGLGPELYRYDQRHIFLEPFGPDKVGWYMTNYDFFHAYGHSYYMLWDNHCYKIDDPQPVYIDDELVAFSARIFLQGDMVTLSLDPRNYVLTNRDGLFQQFPNGGYSLPEPTDWIDINTPEQRPLRWAGAYPVYVYSRPLNYTNRPDPYALTGKNSPGDGYPAGEIYITQEWSNPNTTSFQTSNPVAFGTRAKLATGNATYFQMPRYYNWIGYADYNGAIDTFNWLVQCYLDEDCTIPVKLNLQSAGTLNKVEYQFSSIYITAAGLVTLTKLGGTITTDGHTTRTPSKLYVRYIAEDSHIAYYYP